MTFDSSYLYFFLKSARNACTIMKGVIHMKDLTFVGKQVIITGLKSVAISAALGFAMQVVSNGVEAGLKLNVKELIK